MPPSYKPLPVKIQGSGMEDFFQEPLVTYEDAKNAAMARATREIQLKEQQRQDKYATGYETGLEGNTDLGQGLEIIKKLAIQMGDTDTAINVERAQRQRAQESPLSESQRNFYNSDEDIIPEGVTPEDLRIKAAIRRARNQESVLNDPERRMGRELDNDLKEQRRDGTSVRPLSSAQETKLEAVQNVEKSLTNIKERYFPYLSANRGVAWARAIANSNSAEARLESELIEGAYEKAKAANGSGVLSNQDFKTLAPLLLADPRDTIATRMDKIDRAIDFAKMKGLTLLDIAEKNNRNVSKFRESSNKEDEERAFKEQYKAKLKARGVRG